MKHLTGNKRLNEVLNSLLTEGWSVERCRKHLVMCHESGQRLFMPLSIPDKGTTAANYLAIVKRTRRNLYGGRRGQA